MYKESQLTGKIIGHAMDVHRKLGPGFKEAIYHTALFQVLAKNGFDVESEKEFDVYFDNDIIGNFRIDLYIENKIIVELKAVSGEIPILFKTQVVSYLKASNKEVGLLINFGNTSLDIKRFGNYKNYSKNSVQSNL